MRRLSLTNKTEGARLVFLMTGQIFQPSGMVASPYLTHAPFVANTKPVYRLVPLWKINRLVNS